MNLLLLWILYLLAGSCVAAAAALLGRRLERRVLLAAFALPVVFLAPGFFLDRTALPVDQIRTIPPWRDTSVGAVRNASLLDLVLQIAPWSVAVRAAWTHGELPLRDRWNGCGTPLAANGQSSAFAPLTLWALALPLAQAFTLQAALKLFLAITGMWLWLTELDVGSPAALFGSVLFAFSFTMTPWIYFPLTAVLCLWPWCLFALELVARDRVGRRAFWALVAVFFLWPLSGHVESAASGAAGIGLWLLVRAAASDLPEPGRFFRRVALAAAIAVGLSAFSLLPQMRALAASNRLVLAQHPVWEPLFSWVPHGPGWANGLFTSLFPRCLGDGIDSPMVAGRMGSVLEMGLGYFGVVGSACALLVLRPGSRRRRAGLALLAPILFGFCAAVGLWPFAELVGHAPGLRLIFPLRFFSWLALAGAGLAAFELDRFERDVASDPKAALGPVFAAAALLLFAFVSYRRFRPLHAASGGLDAQREALLLAAAWLAAFVLLSALVAWKPGSIWHLEFSLLVTGLAALELLSGGARLYQYGRPAELYAETPLIRFLRDQPRPYRVLGEGTALFPNSNVFAGLEEIRTHDAAERREYVDLLAATCGYDAREYFKQIQDVNAPVLDFLNVRYLLAAPGRPVPGEKWRPVYSGPDGTVFENSRVLPRVFAPPGVLAASAGAALPRDWHREAALSGSRLGEVLEPGVRLNGPVEISEYEESANSVSFRVRAGSLRRTVLVTSLVQDGGWSAWDKEGHSLPTARANGPFLALTVPAGDGVVHLKYSAPGFRLGIAVSLTSLMAAVFLALAASRRLGAPSRAGIPSPARSHEEVTRAGLRYRL